MKRTNLLLAVLLTLALSACQKENLDIVSEPQTAYFANFLLLHDIVHGQCVEGTSFCLTARPEDPHTNTGPVGTDEFTARPVLQSDGRLVFRPDASIPASSLSDEALDLLLQRRRIVVSNGFFIDEDLIRQAYLDAGIGFSGRRIEIPAGEYEVTLDDETHDANGQYAKVSVTICGEEWCLTITIEF